MKSIQSEYVKKLKDDEMWEGKIRTDLKKELISYSRSC